MGGDVGGGKGRNSMKNFGLLIRFPVVRICSALLFQTRKSLRIMSGDMKPDVVFVLGGPGAGKGTQCEKIIKEFNYIHLSAGELLRTERNSGSEQGELIAKHLLNGTIVPVEITCSLLEKAMIASDVKRFLIDGFPRNENNLMGWTKTMADKVNLQFVLFLDCPDEVCIERCLERGKSGSGRTDDNIESLKKRLVTYANDTMPIIEFYKKLNLVRQIDASQPTEKVFEDVKSAFREVMKP